MARGKKQTRTEANAELPTTPLKRVVLPKAPRVGGWEKHKDSASELTNKHTPLSVSPRESRESNKFGKVINDNSISSFVRRASSQTTSKFSCNDRLTNP